MYFSNRQQISNDSVDSYVVKINFLRGLPAEKSKLKFGYNEQLGTDQICLE